MMTMLRIWRSKQRSGRLRKRTPEQIYHSKKNKHNTQATNHTITRAIYVVRQRCLRPRGGGKFHYESKDYYKMIEERITSHRWWQVEPFKSRNPRFSSRHLRY